MRFLGLSIVALFALLSFDAMARPLSYADGFMIMTENNSAENGVDFNYTVTPKTAFSYHVAYQRGDSTWHNEIGMNNLLWRGNFPDSQGNIYSRVAAGVSTKGDVADPLGFASIMADWEDRRYYTSYAGEYTQVGDEGAFKQKARVGIAPYIGEAGDLHTWLMLEATHRPESKKDTLEITPLVRLFQGTNLLELGYSDQHAVLFNFTKQF